MGELFGGNGSEVDVRSFLVGFLTTCAIFLSIIMARKVSPWSEEGEEEEEKGEGVEEAVSLLPSVVQTAELIRRRRSVFPKDYTGESVPRGVVEGLLSAANWAPTHGKNEPWRFVVFSGTEAVLGVFKAFLRHARVSLADAPPESLAKYEAKYERKLKDRSKISHLIALVMKRRANPEKVNPEWEEIAAVACAVQNMYLMARAHDGVAVYWSSGGVKESAETGGSAEVRQLFGLEETGDRCLGLFHVGMSDRIDKYRAARGAVQAKTRWVGGGEESGSG